MSHHFDTPTAREDPRICVNDFYLFDGAAGTTVMAMTVNPDAGLSAPDTFRDEGLYARNLARSGIVETRAPAPAKQPASQCRGTFWYRCCPGSTIAQPNFQLPEQDSTGNKLVTSPLVN
jgi:hypothetical protein